MNIAFSFVEAAKKNPFKRAVVYPQYRLKNGRVAYTHLTFSELDRESDRYAHGLQSIGITRGVRVLLMVRPSLEFTSLVLALFKTGAIPILIDPGMGVTNLVSCIEDAEPQAMIAVPAVHLARFYYRSAFKSVKTAVIAGPKLFLPGYSLENLKSSTTQPFRIADTAANETAAILFTSGSTGPAKGVVYTHGVFEAELKLIRDFFKIGPDDTDLPCFPLFSLFSTACGATAVIPEMDPTKPAAVDPAKIIEAIERHGVTYSFGSPAIWDRVSLYCLEHSIKLPSLRLILMAGAPVRFEILERFTKILREDAVIHTPYGATEALPVASITHKEIISSTKHLTVEGAGICVGRPLPGVSIKIIAIEDGTIKKLSEARQLNPGEIGEIIVRGPNVTREYYRKPEATELAKIIDDSFSPEPGQAPDSSSLKSTEPSPFWHRMGDTGYFDSEGRLWFCGRKNHRVETTNGTLFSIKCEAIFNRHPDVARSALVGVPPLDSKKPGTTQTPVIIIEPRPGRMPRSFEEETIFRNRLLELASTSPLTRNIRHVLFHPSFPVDVRHNAKIFREKLAVWAAEVLGESDTGDK